jgi:hypothetical protein
MYRYFFPQIIIALIFFTICINQTNGLKPSQINISRYIFVIVLLLGSFTFFQGFTREMRKGKDFNLFNEFAQNNYKESDIFLFPTTSMYSEQLAGIHNYLYPDNTIILNEYFDINNRIGPQKINFDQFSTNLQLFKKPAWIIVDQVFEDLEDDYLIINTKDKMITYYDEFGWNEYTNEYYFRVYYTPSLAEAIENKSLFWIRGGDKKIDDTKDKDKKDDDERPRNKSIFWIRGDDDIVENKKPRY